MDFFHKGGGSEANPKVLGHFLCTNILELLVEKGGGLTKSKSFWALFAQILGELCQKLVPQKFQNFGLSKKCPKSSKIQGGGGRTCFGRSP